MFGHADFKEKALGLAAPFVAALVLCAAVPASAGPGPGGLMKNVNGQAYWDEDPGAVDPGTYWTSGQFKYDPNGYLDRNLSDDQVHVYSVYAQHSGGANCVFRKRVIITNWDSLNPYLRVCRRPE